MTFGSNFINFAEVGQKDADQMIERALEASVNFFDTADAYSSGESEEILGNAFKKLNVNCDDVVIATRCARR